MQPLTVKAALEFLLLVSAIVGCAVLVGLFIHSLVFGPTIVISVIVLSSLAPWIITVVVCIFIGIMIGRRSKS